MREHAQQQPQRRPMGSHLSRQELEARLEALDRRSSRGPHTQEKAHRAAPSAGMTAPTSAPTVLAQAAALEAENAFVVSEEDVTAPQAGVTAPRAGLTAWEQLALPAKPQQKRTLKPQRSFNLGAEGTSKRRRQARKDLPEYSTLTVEGLLGASPKNVREAFYHQRQRLPGLQKQLDKTAFDEVETRLAVLTAAEQLSPQNFALLKDSELQAAMEVLSSSHAWPDELPQTFVKDLLRKRTIQNIAQTKAVFEMVWPFQSGGQAAVGPFDIFNPRLREARVPLDTKVEWMRHWFVNEFLAEHMRLDAAGATAVRELAALVQQEAAAAEMAVTGSTAAQGVVAEVIQLFSVLAVIAQREAVTPQQMQHLSEFSGQKVSSLAGRVVAKLLERPWWEERVKLTWRQASSEAVAAPRLQRVAETLGGEPRARARQRRTRLGRRRSQTWRGGGELRAELVVSTYAAMARGLFADVAQLVSDISAEDLPRVEKVFGRLEWFAGTPAASEIQDMKPLREQLLAARARAKVAHGLQLLEAFVDPKAVGGQRADLLRDLQEGFQDCRGLLVGPGQVDIVRQAIAQIGTTAQVPRELVEVGLHLLALLPSMDGVQCELAEARQASTAPEDVQASTAAEAWQALTTPEQLATMHERLTKSLVAHRLLAVAEDGNLNTAKAGGCCEALTAWEAQPTAVPCVPEALGQEAAAAAEKLHGALKDFATATVDKARLALEAALPVHEKFAGGRLEAGSTWKDKLTAESSWDQVVSAANRHLFHSEHGHVKDRLKASHTELAGAMEAYEEAVRRAQASAPGEGFSMDASLQGRTRAAMNLGLETTAEAYFVEVLTTERKDKIAQKLRGRIASMAKKGMDPGNVLPAIWGRVQDNLA